MILQRQHRKVINTFNLKAGEGIELDSCSEVILRNPVVSGSHINILFRNCTNCLLENPTTFDPIAGSDEAHNIQFDTCNGCQILGGKCINTSKTAVNDNINIWQSTNCLVNGMLIVGCNPLDDSGSGICVDGWLGKSNTILNNAMRNAGQVGIVVAGGEDTTVSGNFILDCNLPAFPNAGNQAITASIAYSQQKNMSGIIISHNTISNIWVDGSQHNWWIGPNTVADISSNILDPAAHKILLARKWN